VNDQPLPATLVGSNSGANVFSMQQIIYLQDGDRISIRNVHTTSVTTAVGFDTPNQNIDMTIFKIAPLPEKCCLPPPICEKIEWTSECCSSSEKYSDKCKTECKTECKKGETKNDKSPFVAPKQNATQVTQTQQTPVVKNTLKYNKNN
jgi:hypothetical protein